MLTTRMNERVAVSEREALLRLTGLSDDELVNVRMEQNPTVEVDFSDWNGIILCGSHFDVSAPFEKKTPLQREVEASLFQLSGRLIAEDFPLLGICYGLGIMAQYLGGKVGPEISEDISAPVLSITTQGRLDPILDGIPRNFRAYLGHHESVVERPREMIPLVTGDIAPVQMARIKNNIYLTQFHPELDFDGISLRIDVFADHGYYPIEERNAVEERVKGVDVSFSHRILSNFVSMFGSE